MLFRSDMLATMEERLHKDCRCCVNYERCGEPDSKPSQEKCKAMWRSFFEGADTPKKLAKRMFEAVDCTGCPVAGMCRELMCEWECVNTIRAWLMNENLLYSMAIAQH